MKQILITGAASGLGKALAEYYAGKGWSVCIADVQEDAAQALAEQLSNAHATDCFAVKLDVTQDEQWLALQNEVSTRWQGLDAIINNAGVASSGAIDKLSMKDFQWTMDINIMGVVKGCHYMTPLLKKRGGNIVNVASMAGLIHMPNMSAYNASKAAVVALSETLFAELKPFNIHVSVLCPAFFQTNLTNTMRSSDQSGLHIAKKLMKQSKITAQQIAEQVYKESMSGKFYLLTHPAEKRFWYVKRFFPSLYLRLVTRISQKFNRKVS